MSEKQSRLTGMLRLRHLLEANEAKAEEMEAVAPRFHRLADKASSPRVVSAFNLFQTPETLASRIAGMLAEPHGRTLEPSAGLGRLYRAVRNRSACPVVLVDSSRECCGELYRAIEGDAAATLLCGDFLTMDAERLGGRFDSIVMNPPFKMGADIRHVRHALMLLAPGGRLVAICANGPRQRAALRPMADEWIDLPAGTFREVGTGVSAAIIVKNAPAIWPTAVRA